jgi:hypothetical protein
MSYFATVSVDIKNGKYGDYENVCAAFEKLGLERAVSGHSRGWLRASLRRQAAQKLADL